MKHKSNSTTKTILDTWLKRYLKVKKVCSFDVETTGLDFRNSHIFSYCIGHSDGTSEVWRLDGNIQKANEGWKRLKEFFADASIAKVAHNHKFELQFLHKHNIEIAEGTVFHDTMLMSRMLRNLAPRHTLDYLCWEICEYEIETPFGVFGSRELDRKVREQAKARGERYDKVDKVLMEYYQIADAERPILLFLIWEQYFKKDLKLYRDYIAEVLTMQVTERMEKVGIRLHWNEANKLHEWLEEELEKVRDETYKLLGEYVNLNSEQQLVRLLYRRLGLPVLKKTDSGNPATDKFVVLEMRKKYDNPIFDLILRNRSYTTAKSMLESYFQKANSEGNIYPTINSCQAKTHRQSSENPNMQNVGKGLYDPDQNPFPVNMRKVFRTPKGAILCLGDYAGIEMRLIIEVANCIKMMDIMRSGGNVHVEACKLFYTSFKSKKENKSLYSYGKNGHFALGYGAGPRKIQTTLRLDTIGATIEALDRYRAEFPEIVDCSKTIARVAKKQGYIQTKFGNKLDVPSTKTYTALNSIIQCTAAKMLKRAEINIDTYSKNIWSGDVELPLVIHDEVVLKIPRHLLKHRDEILYDCSVLMCDMPEIKVPLEVEWKKTLTTWDKAEDIFIKQFPKNYKEKLTWVKNV